MAREQGAESLLLESGKDELIIATKENN